MSGARSFLHHTTDMVKARTPHRFRRDLVRARLTARRATGGMRRLPGLLVIGTQRGGTSSLYKYLGRHPNVAPSLRKEVAYFSTEYDRGIGWYRAHFPLSVPMDRRIAFEATPDYLFHPLASERAAELLPDARVLVLLRNPIERAVSHYHHMRRLGFETLDLADALDAEPERLAGDLEQSLRDLAYRPKQWMRFSYVARGHYADQLGRWLDHYPSQQVMVVQSEELYVHTADVLSRIESWLEVPAWLPAEFRNYSYISRRAEAHDPLPAGLGDRLMAAYVDEPGRLAELVGRRFTWW